MAEREVQGGKWNRTANRIVQAFIKYQMARSSQPLVITSVIFNQLDMEFSRDRTSTEDYIDRSRSAVRQKLERSFEDRRISYKLVGIEDVPEVYPKVLASNPPLNLKQTVHEMRKFQFMDYIKAMMINQPIPIRPIPYKHKGMTNTQDIITLTGTKEFIDSILSRISRDIEVYESLHTRVDPRYGEIYVGGKPTGFWRLTLRVQDRGPEAVERNERTGRPR